MLRYIFRAGESDVFSQNYSLAEFEESDHDDESLGRAGNISQKKSRNVGIKEEENSGDHEIFIKRISNDIRVTFVTNRSNFRLRKFAETFIVGRRPRGK